MRELPEQKYPSNRGNRVDVEMLGDKQNSKAFRGAAYSIGLGVGFLILSPLLGDFNGHKQISDMIELIRVMAIWMIVYALIVVFAYIKMRKQMRAVLFMLNWFLIPTFGLWFILRVADIFSNIPPELQP